MPLWKANCIICQAIVVQVFPAAEEDGAPRFFADLSSEEKAKMLKDRLKKYTQKVSCLILPV